MVTPAYYLIPSLSQISESATYGKVAIRNPDYNGTEALSQISFHSLSQISESATFLPMSPGQIPIISEGRRFPVPDPYL